MIATAPVMTKVTEARVSLVSHSLHLNLNRNLNPNLRLDCLNSDLSPGLGLDASLPLPPALSHRGEGGAASVSRISSAPSPPQPAHNNSPSPQGEHRPLRTTPPSPWGEGRGEGGTALSTATVHSNHPHIE